MLIERRLNNCLVNHLYVIKRFDHLPTPTRCRLESLGVSEGREIYLIQRRPIYVISCDYTQIALDNTLAKAIIVTNRGC